MRATIRHLRVVAAAVGIGGSWASALPASWAQTGPEIDTRVGAMYPDFRLPDVDGSFKRLSDYRGRKVLLIHFASW